MDYMNVCICGQYGKVVDFTTLPTKLLQKIKLKKLISCKIKWPKKMTHREISDIMLSDQTKHDWRFQNESLTV